jgi:hypothetical protein
MGKFNSSSRNKQVELARKMELAKKQRDPEESPTAEDTLEDEEDSKLQEDRSKFAQLLAKSPPPPPEPNERAFTRSESKSVPSRGLSLVPSSATNSQPKVNAKDLKRRKKASIAAENAEKKSKVFCANNDTRILQHLSLTPAFLPQT